MNAVRPDMAKRNLSLGEDYKGRAVHGNRDVWVVRLADDTGQKWVCISK